MIRTLIIFGGLIGPIAVAEPINRVKLWTDAEVDVQAKKWGEEVAREDGASAQHKGLAKWRKDIVNSDQLPANERIDLLSKALDKISRFSIYQVGERIEIYDMARYKMASIPDHAKYFTDPIEESYRLNAKRVRLFESQPEWKAAGENAKLTDEGSLGMFNLISGMWGDYDEIYSKNLGMLGHIPSTESVRALGRYLRKRDEPDIEIHPPYTGELAVESLTELISDGPIQTELVSVDDVPKWQKWFDEVKAGRRTFRFVGSDVNYTLDGPADAATLKRIKEEKMTSQRPDRTKKHIIESNDLTHTNGKGPVFHLELLAAILVCLVGFIYFFRGRRRNELNH